MTDFPRLSSAQEVRDHVIDFLRREMVGPSPGHPFVQLDGEEALRLQDTPRQRYCCGILFPRGITYSGSLDLSELGEAVAADGADSTIDTAVAPIQEDAGVPSSDIIDGDGVPDDARSDQSDEEIDDSPRFLPASIGLSFLADVSSGLRIDVRWATYARASVPAGGADGTATTKEYWFRRPGHGTVHLPATELGHGAGRLRFRTGSGQIPPLIQGDQCLVLDVVSRPWGDPSVRLITVTLMNAGQQKSKLTQDCYYQCSLEVVPEQSSRIKPYPGPSDTGGDDEASLSLLYRHRPNFAVGHGCAADWSVDENGDVTLLRTETLPVFRQKPVMPMEDLEGVDLSLLHIAAADREEIVSMCSAIAAAYERWIGKCEAEVAADQTLTDTQRGAARRHMDDCRRCLERIRGGASMIEVDEDVLAAFRLMNRAMLEQREHYGLSAAEDGRRKWVKGEDGAVPDRPFVRPAYPDSTKWRPFQIAFILMNIRSMADPRHDERDLVDVIWFPTGGGKTEAYLGLAAFTILMRRLKDPTNGGATVLMRYTLRLLTTQQFQRATSLICALELIRRRNSPTFGPEPISIGAWLGGQTTPNTNRAAVIAYNEATRSGSGNAFILLACPWCGVEMGPRKYAREFRVFGVCKEGAGRQERVRFRCEDPDCDFSGDAGLPVDVVDETIYGRPSTLVIGTVDKFAMMPWQPEARRLFGIDNPGAGTPPDLIIQDELHLISGPLGSVVGHYETVVDEFCTDREAERPVRAKIIASTATIARAAEQIRGLYGRSSALFPPQGLRAGESFFAREDANAEGRTYVGIMATAAPSAVTAQKSVLAALLQAPALVDGPDKAVDPYWTLITYFNSLRELGRAATLVQADVREHLNAVWDRIGLTRTLGCTEADMGHRRFINTFRELTSRVQNTQIPEILGELFSPRATGRAVDLCYATNMIQVGLDVPRLSLMLIVGQPKGASEYIQASSRVGRSQGRPGLVVTNCNPFKPRDRSHFESFRSFHENAYRHVEPTSVTPFAVPVCERAIHALAVSVLRFRFEKLRERPGGGPDANQRRHVEDVIRRRVAAADPGETERAMAILNRFLDDWSRTAPQEYGAVGGRGEDPLLWPSSRPLPPRLMDRMGVIRPTGTSMRNTDAECAARPSTEYP